VVTVRDRRITAVAPHRPGMPVTWDLSALTLLPGLIDTHVHLDGHFGPSGRADNRGETPEQRLRAAEENAQRTVRAGFTTVQSLGAPIDLTLREELRAGRAEGPRLLTSVLSRDAVERVLGAIHGVPWLTGSLLYGSGLRLMECCQLRVKDVDLDRPEIRVRRGKGARDWVPMLAQSLVEPLHAHPNAIRVAMQRAVSEPGRCVDVEQRVGCHTLVRNAPFWRRATTSGRSRSSWGTVT
jgi:imidazolonepropionase-like amidohydrolase